MKKIFIFGSGSIGNHLTNAGLRSGYEVYITDKSEMALKRMKNELFKKRYGYWSNKIKIIKNNELKKIYRTKFDLVIIGTPPKSHIKLYEFCKKNMTYKKILIEKPLCVYNENFKNIISLNKYIFCGYNHSVSDSFRYFIKLLNDNKKNYFFSTIKWKEGWTGILNAHYWLKDEFSSYLGNIEEGGGAIHEHSHPIHLAVLILKTLSKENIKVETSNLVYKYNKKVRYDSFANILLKSKKFKIDLEIDLLEPGSKKEVTVYFKNFIMRWIHNYTKSSDAVIIYSKFKYKIKLFKKNRETEFISELKDIAKTDNKNKYKNSKLNVSNALEVMNIIKKVIKNENLRAN